MLRLVDIEQQKRARLARAINSLKTVNPDYKDFLDWLEDRLSKMREQNDTIIDETKLRMQQGQCQCLQSILNIHNEATELIRSN